MGISNGSPSDSQHCRDPQSLQPRVCSQTCQGETGLGIPPRLRRLLRLGSFTIPNFQHLFTFRITGRCPRSSPFKRTLGVCTGGRVEGLAADVIFMKRSCHKPHCCVIARWALKGRGSLPRSDRKLMKDIGTRACLEEQGELGTLLSLCSS